MMNAKLALASLAFASLAACGGGSDAPAPSPAPAPNGGIWDVDATVNGAHVQGQALITEDGRLVSVSQNLNNGCADIAVGNVTEHGDAVSGTDTVVFVTQTTGGTNTSCTFADGSYWGTQTLNGTIVRGSTLTFSGTTTTANGSVFSSPAVTATFNSMYLRPSALAKLAGTWTIPSLGISETFDANGVLSAHDRATNCTYSGRASLIDGRYNAYGLENTASGCAGDAAVLNGKTVHAVMTLDDTATPSLLFTGGSLTVNGVTVLATTVWQR